MATIIYCDRIKHVVEESRSDVERIVHQVMEAAAQSTTAQGYYPAGFAYFTIKEINGVGGQQRALNVSKISSFEAHPGDPI